MSLLLKWSSTILLYLILVSMRPLFRSTLDALYCTPYKDLKVTQQYHDLNSHPGFLVEKRLEPFVCSDIVDAKVDVGEHRCGVHLQVLVFKHTPICALKCKAPSGHVFTVFVVGGALLLRGVYTGISNMDM